MVKRIFKHFHFEYFFFVALFLFSCLLFWKTFYLSDGQMNLATKLWSDFGATIPLERSFAFGSNFPPQYPIFAGPPIRYHFVFFLIVGMLERIGVPLDWALNGMSIIGFFGLLLVIYYLAAHVFKSKFVGTVSVILFLFNGSFGFLEYFKRHPLTWETPNAILHGVEWTSFGPYDGKTVSAFWSLNIFTNQRHLALGYACYLALLYFLYRTNSRKQKVHHNNAHLRHAGPDPASAFSTTWRRILNQVQDDSERLSYTSSVLIGILVGLFPFIHLTAYMMMCITLLVAFVFFGNIRKQILIMGLVAGLLGIPQILAMGQSVREVKLFNPGYLIDKPLDVTRFLTYWFLNLGLTSILAIIGFVLANKEQRKLFIPFLVFFAIGNLFQFSPEMASNHKFFNLFAIGTNIFTAYTLYRLWKVHFATKLLIPILLIPLTLTGIIDLFPIFNDRYMVLDDIPKNPTAQFILKNTPPDAVFLNAAFLYDPASLAGRKIYLGWPYFSWSAGYDTDTRFKLMKEKLATTDLDQFCAFTRSENINYLEIQQPTSLEDTHINYDFFKRQKGQLFYDPKSNIRIYDISLMCSS